MPQRLKRKIYKYIPILKRITFVIAVVVLLMIAAGYSQPYFRFASENHISFTLIADLLLRKDIPLQSYQGRTNFLLLGIEGGSHDGANLTDSIILISIDPVKKNSVMVSIPRDIWIQTLHEKINTAYQLGEEKKTGGGFILAKSTVEELTGLPVHYSWLVDSSGFAQMIDILGGVDITVSRPFTDTEFPIDGKENDTCGGDLTYACRYQTVSFTAGKQHFNGTQALWYVRSRHAEGDEGTDFARGRRQQEILTAIKDRLIKKTDWINPKILKSLFITFNKAIKSDMDWSERLILLSDLEKMKNSPIKQTALDEGDPEHGSSGLLVNPPADKYDGMWVLVPKTGDFAEIHGYLSCSIYGSNCPKVN